MTNKGFSIQLPFTRHEAAADTYTAILGCQKEGQEGPDVIGIFLSSTQLRQYPYFTRVMLNGTDLTTWANFYGNDVETLDVFVPQPTINSRPRPLNELRVEVGFETDAYPIAIKSHHPSLCPVERSKDPWNKYPRYTHHQSITYQDDYRGILGTFEFDASDTTVSAVSVGLDHFFLPTIQLHSKDEAQRMVLYTDIITPSALQENLHPHPGSEALSHYHVFHQARSWYFSMDAGGLDHLGCESPILQPGSSSPNLSAYIDEASVQISVHRNFTNDRKRWNLSLSFGLSNKSYSAYSICDNEMDTKWHHFGCDGDEARGPCDGDAIGSKEDENEHRRPWRRLQVAKNEKYVLPD